jgi:bifunctional isochorismate lyase / aryl carrier protein
MPIARIAPYEIPRVGSWPSCRAPWSFDPARAALLVHDMQSYFLRPYEPNASPLAPLLAHVKALRSACASSGVPVIFSAQPGEQSQSERGLLWDLWGPGIVEHPEQGTLAPELAPGPTDVLLAKRRYSAFHDTRLYELLRERGRDQLVICGVYAHIGCLATATDGFMRGIQPFVIADATADFSPEDHAVALRQVARTCGVVSTTREILEPIQLRRLRSTLGELLDTAVDRIGLDDDLSDHGLDSVRALSFFERVLPRDHGLDFSDLVQARSLRALNALLSPRAGLSH